MLVVIIVLIIVDKLRQRHEIIDSYLKTSSKTHYDIINMLEFLKSTSL